MEHNKLSCDCDIIHPGSVDAARSAMPPGEQLARLAEFMSKFSDCTRVRILWALDSGELCVCDLAKLLDMTKSAVSHQLRVLRDADLVRARRDGREIYYSLADHHVREILEKATEHINEKRN